jgi:predicted transcriptional regulator
MYHDEIHHLGRPHFHARYGEDEASVEIESLEVLAGRLSPRALRLVTDWASQHLDELRENWERARRHEPLVRIEPLS